MGFGDFMQICETAALPMCSLLGPVNDISGHTGIQAKCYSRTIDLANTIIFQGAADFMHILAMIMTIIMILHVRSKFTAVGMLKIWFLIDKQFRLSANHMFNVQVARKSLRSSTSTCS